MNEQLKSLLEDEATQNTVMRSDSTRSFHDREDNCQDCYVKAIEADRDGKQYTWGTPIFITFNQNNCRDKYRKAKVPISADTGIVEAECRDKILAAVDLKDIPSLVYKRLSPQHYQVLYLHSVNNLTAREISRKLGMREGTVKTWLRRDKNRLKNDSTLQVYQ